MPPRTSKATRSSSPKATQRAPSVRKSTGSAASRKSSASPAKATLSRTSSRRKSTNVRDVSPDTQARTLSPTRTSSAKSRKGSVQTPAREASVDPAPRRTPRKSNGKKTESPIATAKTVPKSRRGSSSRPIQLSRKAKVSESSTVIVLMALGSIAGMPSSSNFFTLSL